jgi:hypothetical protein
MRSARVHENARHRLSDRTTALQEMQQLRLGIPQGRGGPYNEGIREPGDEKPRKFLRRKKWQKKQPFKLRRASFKGQGLQPDQRSASWESLRELAYGDRSG